MMQALSPPHAFRCAMKARAIESAVAFPAASRACANAAAILLSRLESWGSPQIANSSGVAALLQSKLAAAAGRAARQTRNEAIDLILACSVRCISRQAERRAGAPTPRQPVPLNGLAGRFLLQRDRNRGI